VRKKEFELCFKYFYRDCWDFVPKITMPKAFMMSGKRRADTDNERFIDTDHEGKIMTTSHV